MILGDFNSVLGSMNKIWASPITDTECQDFKDTLFNIQVQELNYVGWP